MTRGGVAAGHFPRVRMEQPHGIRSPALAGGHCTRMIAACCLPAPQLAQPRAALNEVIAVPYVLIADEAEEMVNDATAGEGDLDLGEVGSHMEMLADNARTIHTVDQRFIKEFMPGSAVTGCSRR